MVTYFKTFCTKHSIEMSWQWRNAASTYSLLQTQNTMFHQFCISLATCCCKLTKHHRCDMSFCPQLKLTIFIFWHKRNKFPFKFNFSTFVKIAETGRELMRPFLHEFLSSAYEVSLFYTLVSAYLGLRSSCSYLGFSDQNDICENCKFGHT